MNQANSSGQRINLPALILGLALLGLLVMSSQTYSLFAFLTPEQIYRLNLDRATSYVPTQFFVQLFIKGQGASLVSFIGGWRFYELWQTGQQAGRKANSIAQRGLLALLMIGLGHGLLLWFGDGLHQFALLGFSLLFFSKQSVPSLIRWMVGLLSLGILLHGVQQMGATGSWPMGMPEKVPIDSLTQSVVHTWQRGTFWQVMRMQGVELRMGYARALKQGLTPYLQHEVMLLLGVVVGKLRLIDRLAEFRVQMSLLLLWLFPLAIMLKGLASLRVMAGPVLPKAWQAYESLLFTLGDFLGIHLLTLVYLLELGLTLKPASNRLGRWLSQTGRMGLTNYLLQTGLCMVLFYGYGMGLSGKLSLLESLGVALAIFILELFWSQWWLGHHRQGPLQKLVCRWAAGKTSQNPAHDLS